MKKPQLFLISESKFGLGCSRNSFRSIKLRVKNPSLVSLMICTNLGLIFDEKFTKQEASNNDYYLLIANQNSELGKLLRKYNSLWKKYWSLVGKRPCYKRERSYLYKLKYRYVTCKKYEKFANEHLLLEETICQRTEKIESRIFKILFGKHLKCHEEYFSGENSPCRAYYLV